MRWRNLTKSTGESSSDNTVFLLSEQKESIFSLSAGLELFLDIFLQIQSLDDQPASLFIGFGCKFEAVQNLHRIETSIGFKLVDAAICMKMKFCLLAVVFIVRYAIEQLNLLDHRLVFGLQILIKTVFVARN